MPKFKNAAAADKWAQITYGCSSAEAHRINTQPLQAAGGYAAAYRHQKHGAKKRGIPWKFTFPEWVDCWLSSGRWPLRGVGVGKYCMARHGDIGAYEPRNVSIQLCTENSRDGIEKARRAMALAARKNSRAGSGRGWTYRPEKGGKPYQVCVGNKYVGCFATAEEAVTAYAAAVVCHLDSRNL